MKWTKDSSVFLSRVCVALFAVTLLALDITAFRWVPWFAALRLVNRSAGLLYASVTLCSICAWLCLLDLWKLLSNLNGETVFTEENISLLRGISWCCAGAASVCLASAVYYLPFLAIAIAAAFMMLIVRIIKNLFRRAADMREELDLTV